MSMKTGEVQGSGMSKVAARAFDSLLVRAERAWTRNSGATIALRMSDASFRAYLDLSTRRETDEFHAAMRNAERAGAIRIEWDRLAGEDGQIQRVVLLDRNKLASYLAITPLWDACKAASDATSQYQDHAGLQRLLAAWKAGKRPRGIGPEQLRDVLDAMRVISTLELAGHEDVPVRQISSMLFHDSKRLEGLLSILDFITQEDESCTIARQPEDVLATLGLIKYPQPALIAGHAKLVFSNGDTLGIPLPYIGVAPQSLQRIDVSPSSHYILTVENFTPFNEIVKGKAGSIEGVVIYTAGMPSPSFLRFYAMVLGGADQTIPIYHWGDIDLGGFRIANVLANQAEQFGRGLRLWNMNPVHHMDIPRWRDLASVEMSWMKTIACKHNWGDEWGGIEATAAAYEQEMLPVSVLPTLRADSRNK